MKLCRFELRESPGVVRSGIVHGAKVYETDGANPIAVHEAEDIRPLPPVGQPSSVRLVVPSSEPETDSQPLFAYLNPSSLIGPSKIIPYPAMSGSVDYEAYLCAVMANPGANIPLEYADDMILGYSILLAVVLQDIRRQERSAGIGPGRSFDTAMALGPVLTTPDELEDFVAAETDGKRFELNVVTRVAGVEMRRGNTIDLPFSFAQAISAASETVALRAGDIFAMGPIASAIESPEPMLAPVSDLQVSVEHLGTLSLKLSS